MKNFKSFLLITAVAATFAACTKVDNPGSPVTAVDDGEWTVSPNYIDESYAPGDNFYYYALGNLLKKNKIDPTDRPVCRSYMFQELGGSLNQRLATISRPSNSKLFMHVSDMDKTSEQAKNILKEMCNKLNAATTREEAWKITGELMAQGAVGLLDFAPLNYDGKVGFFLNPHSSTLVTLTASLTKSIEQLQDPEFIKNLRPLAGPTRRAFSPSEWPMINAWCQGFGVDPSNVLMLDEYYSKTLGTSHPNLAKFISALKQIQESDLDNYKSQICECIAEDSCFVSKKLYNSTIAVLAKEGSISSEQASTLELSNLYNVLYSGMCSYEYSKQFCDKYITDDIVSNVKTRCEELRKVFTERIQRNTWMSEASKTNAINKLNAITFNAGKPDKWYSEGITDISSNTCLLQDVIQLRKTKNSLYKALYNKPISEAGMHIIAMMAGGGLTQVNAFYHQNYVGVYILPVFCLPPAIDPSVNEAEQYATAMVFGHEITHGFDSRGANFDKNGLYNPIWGSDADKAMFEKLGKQYADYFSSILVMPDELPDVYCDGTFTLTENIADLGGIEIAFDAYNKRLKAQGFSGSELIKQQKRFFLALTRNWWAVYNKAYALLATQGEGPKHLEKDIHALFKERVNGPFPNVDAWYNLFDVKASNKMYLAPDKRTHIW